MLFVHIRAFADCGSQMSCLSHLYVVLQILIVTVPQHLDLMQGRKGPDYALSGRVTALMFCFALC